MKALLNAVIHKDYSSGVPFQISVYRDKLMIWNPGQGHAALILRRVKNRNNGHILSLYAILNIAQEGGL